MNRIDRLFQEKKENILSVYFTAGYPSLHDTANLIKELDLAGVDMLEVGIPFSDPVADGPIIQQSSLEALNNGMNLRLLFEQLAAIRQITDMPLVLMGYLNPIMQYGYDEFCKSCHEVGIDGVIIPDLPPELYEKKYKSMFEAHGIHAIFLVTPQSSDTRIIELDKATSGFLYVVSSSATTGVKRGFDSYQIEYFKRLQRLGLKSPKVVGFGISSNETFNTACEYAQGAIIGSAFVKALGEPGKLSDRVNSFVNKIQENKR